MEMSFRRKRQKTIKLRTLFLKYLAVFCAGTIGLVLAIVLIFSGLMTIGAILPANYAEQQVMQIREEIQAGQQPELDDPHALFRYAKYTLDGRLLEHNLSSEQAAAAWNLLEDREFIYRYPYNYAKAVNDQDVYILRYSLSAQFNHPGMQRVLPNAEICFIVIFCIAFLIGVGLLASSFGRKLTLKLSGLQEAAKHIQKQDLAFAIRYSGIAEIDQVLQSMDQMRNALRNSLERQWKLERSRRQQVSALAHDVKTPLTIVRGNADLLAETDLTAEQEEYVRYIAESAGKMEDYINRLIEITKAEHAASYQPVHFTICPFIQKIEDQMNALAVTKSLACNVITCGLPDTVYGDPGLLERALMNVIANAVDHSPYGGKLTFIAEQIPGSIRFCIRDEGPGFSPEALRLAAEPFYMGDASRGASGHYGMGLYITQFVADLHGGKLLIANSEAAGGGEVSLTLPYEEPAHET
ncbi:two-component sensor histidine kinase [Insulibacter thermoxylanivorax]|uniref:histidine kinase n=2 Tax=Insulibacter thermoxylanivorax TaxID=2749268 RepID=A0A916QF69_9BACL|nr:two-component sensor histidine kinase [Insulibacter thermoxylanivorax]